MEVKIELRGAASVAWLKSVLDGYETARAADAAEEDRRWKEERIVSMSSGSTEDYIAEAQAANPQPAEAEKPKRTRKAKEDPAPTVELETAAQITTSPEDRKPVEEIEEAEVVDVFEEAPAARVFTRDDVKAAMQVYVAKHGMDKLAANAADLLGAPKLSAIPEDAAAFEAAVKRLEAALA